MIHIFHSFQTGMVFEIVNPFSWIFNAISSEKIIIIIIIIIIMIIIIRLCPEALPSYSFDHFLRIEKKNKTKNDLTCIHCQKRMMKS